VFSTKERRPFLRDANLRNELHHYLGGILKQHDCQPIVIDGFADHVHILSTLARTCDTATMVKEVKRGYSMWLKQQEAGLAECSWQNGYGIFSIGASQIPTVKRYILRQEEHHRRISYQNELRKLLTLYGIEFDERYVWD
jgi:REP element-mobilizing transposase RayT